MENLSFAHRSDHEPATFYDAVDAPTRGGGQQSVSNPPSAYRAVSLIDSMSAYAAVFNCSAGCSTVTT